MARCRNARNQFRAHALFIFGASCAVSENVRCGTLSFCCSRRRCCWLLLIHNTYNMYKILCVCVCVCVSLPFRCLASLYIFARHRHHCLECACSSCKSARNGTGGGDFSSYHTNHQKLDGDSYARRKLALSISPRARARKGMRICVRYTTCDI